MNIDWNAQEYLQDFSFVPRYGEDVLNLLDAHAGTWAVETEC